VGPERLKCDETSDESRYAQRSRATACVRVDIPRPPVNSVAGYLSDLGKAHSRLEDVCLKFWAKD
jgi:hypothetical protein